MSIVAYGLGAGGPDPTIVTYGYGLSQTVLLPSVPGIEFDVPTGGVTFTPFTGTVLFTPNNLDVTFEVREMQYIFKVPQGTVTFKAIDNTKIFVVPPGALGKVFKPK